MNKEEKKLWWNGLLEYIKTPKDQRKEISQEYGQALLRNSWELFPIGSKVMVSKKVVPRGEDMDDPANWELNEEGVVTEHGWSVHQPGNPHKLIGVCMANYKYGTAMKYNAECTPWDLQLLQLPEEMSTFVKIKNNTMRIHQKDEPCDKYNRWNRLINIRDSIKDQIAKEYAENILKALNTAGGPEIIGSEADSFIMKNKNLWVKE